MNYAPWHPITDPVDLKHLGKLAEELGEGVQAVSRCIIQGTDEYNVKGDKSNILCLQDEIGDILANIDLVVERFGLDKRAMLERAAMKKPKLRQWHAMA